jgi:hypothetical protein
VIHALTTTLRDRTLQRRLIPTVAFPVTPAREWNRFTSDGWPRLLPQQTRTVATVDEPPRSELEPRRKTTMFPMLGGLARRAGR